MKACGNGRWMQSLICGSRGCCALVAGMLWWLLLAGAALAAPSGPSPCWNAPKAATPDPRTEVTTRQVRPCRSVASSPLARRMRAISSTGRASGCGSWA